MDGKVALITGSARGIGRAFAEKLLSHGAKVLLVDMDEVKGKETETTLNVTYGINSVIYYRCDVTSKDDMEDAFEAVMRTFGKLDILCNNAGVLVEAGAPVDPEQMIAVNLTSVIHWTMKGIQYMSPPTGCGGVIINTASTAGFNLTVYHATKHGVLVFTRGIGSQSEKRHKVRINCICPSNTETDIYIKVKEMKEMKEMLMTHQNTHGLLQPDEVADAFYDLLQMESLSGAAMVVLKGTRQLVTLPTTLDEILAVSDILSTRV